MKKDSRDTVNFQFGILFIWIDQLKCWYYRLIHVIWSFEVFALICAAGKKGNQVTSVSSYQVHFLVM